jgi:imidazolonepropionase-like amidohydrolase
MRTSKVLFICLLAAAPSLRAQVTAVRSQRMLDVKTGAYVPNAVVLIEKGKITAAGSGLAIPPGAAVIDLGTATLLPGLIDAHSHLMARIAEGNIVNNYILQLAKEPEAYRALEGAYDARLTLRAGFTTVRDVESEGSGYADVAHGYRSRPGRGSADAGGHSRHRRHGRLSSGAALARSQGFSARRADDHRRR